MPNFATGNFKQKNKPFKGKKNVSKSFKGINMKATENKKLNKKIKKKDDNKIVTENNFSSNKKQKAQKLRLMRKNERKMRMTDFKKQTKENRINNIMKSQLISNDIKEVMVKSLKGLNPTKIIVLMNTNSANVTLFLQELEKMFLGKKSDTRFNGEINLNEYSFNSVGWEYLYIDGNASEHKQFKNENFLFLVSPKDPLLFLDYCKIADCIMPICTSSNVNYDILNTNPKDALNAIDDWGLQSIVWLRSQGMLSVQPVVLDISTAKSSKVKDVKFYMDRLFKEEFDTNNSCCFLEKPDDLIMLLLRLAGVSSPNILWRDMRGYMLAEKVSLANDNKKVLILFLWWLVIV